MKTREALAAMSIGLGLASGCSGGDDTDDGTGGAGVNTGGAGASTGGAGGAGADLCEVGCMATMEADCANGPASQAACESDCQSLREGACGTEYRALQDCAARKSLECNAAGLPSRHPRRDDRRTEWAARQPARPPSLA